MTREQRNVKAERHHCYFSFGPGPPHLLYRENSRLISSLRLDTPVLAKMDFK